ncbi:MAG: Rpn family recombination-promoting nuclease/putative transposase, partial [Planctomycetaceae bacterium]|nr:Rpn family recombination-promoting nuclease/putative transposase [Planctomycetaceae bacterium]
MRTQNLPPDKSPEKESQSGNIFDTYIRQVFSQITVFADFLLSYADSHVVEKLDLRNIIPFPTHSFDRQGKERISDLIFLCGLKCCAGVMGVIIIFEHAGGS